MTIGVFPKLPMGLLAALINLPSGAGNTRSPPPKILKWSPVAQKWLTWYGKVYQLLLNQYFDWSKTWKPSHSLVRLYLGKRQVENYEWVKQNAERMVQCWNIFLTDIKIVSAKILISNQKSIICFKYLSLINTIKFSKAQTEIPFYGKKCLGKRNKFLA